MSEIHGEFKIVGYVDDLEDAVMSAEKRDMPGELIDIINSTHDEIVELEPLLSTQEHYDKLSESVERVIDEIVRACRANDVKVAMENAEKIRDNVATLKAELS